MARISANISSYCDQLYSCALDSIYAYCNCGSDKLVPSRVPFCIE